jgi:hypothetical protein
MSRAFNPGIPKSRDIAEICNSRNPGIIHPGSRVSLIITFSSLCTHLAREAILPVPWDLQTREILKVLIYHYKLEIFKVLIYYYQLDLHFLQDFQFHQNPSRLIYNLERFEIFTVAKH